MRFSLIPKFMYRDIYAIEPSWLKEQGVRVVLADLDNTLARYREYHPSERLRQWEEGLRAQQICLFVLSNSRKKTRADVFCEGFIPYMKHAGKPKKGGFHRALQENHITAQQAVMVGDQIFTDILGGNRSGIRTILVRPVAIDNPFRLIRFAIETPFRALCPNRKHWT